jgi:hypothetical protein
MGWAESAARGGSAGEEPACGCNTVTHYSGNFFFALAGSGSMNKALLPLLVSKSKPKAETSSAADTVSRVCGVVPAALSIVPLPDDKRRTGGAGDCPPLDTWNADRASSSAITSDVLAVWNVLKLPLRLRGVVAGGSGRPFGERGAGSTAGAPQYTACPLCNSLPGGGESALEAPSKKSWAAAFAATAATDAAVAAAMAAAARLSGVAPWRAASLCARRAGDVGAKTPGGADEGGIGGRAAEYSPICGLAALNGSSLMLFRLCGVVVGRGGDPGYVGRPGTPLNADDGADTDGVDPCEGEIAHPTRSSGALPTRDRCGAGVSGDDGVVVAM